MQRVTFNGLVGAQPVQSIDSADSTRQHPMGMLVTAYDDYWGGGEFMYVRAASGTINQFALCTLTSSYDSGLGAWQHKIVNVPNTANLGKQLCVAMSNMVNGDHGWVCVSGIVPVNCNASVAADTAFGIAATGQGGALTAGKQVCNAVVAIAATHTKVKAGWTQGLSTELVVSDTNGWFKGIYLSGTGIAAGTTVTKIDPDERTVTLSLATTATIAGTNVTGTYNNATVHYNIASINRPFAQGQIL